MWQLRERLDVVVDSLVPARAAGRRSLSGDQVLEALMRIANEADRSFTPKMLQNFWEVFGVNKYARYVRDIAASCGLNENPLYDPDEPISGYNRHHHISKRRLRVLLPSLNIIDQRQLERTAEDEELLLVSYHIWYVAGSSKFYFDAAAVSKIQEFYLRINGMKETAEVKQEIVRILEPYRINPKENPVDLLTSLPRDLFAYKERLFGLGRKRGDYFQNDGEWVDLVWALGLYTRWPEPIGYLLLNKEVRDKKKLFLPQAE